MVVGRSGHLGSAAQLGRPAWPRAESEMLASYEMDMTGQEHMQHLMVGRLQDLALYGEAGPEPRLFYR